MMITGGSQSVTVTPQWNNPDELPFFDESLCYVAYRTSLVGGDPNAIWIPTSSPGIASSPGQHTITSGAFFMNPGTSYYIAVGDNVSALPITLLSFETSNNNSLVNLNWATASEINNNYFSIERSTNGQSWQTIGKVDGHGNSMVIQTYSFVDNFIEVIPKGIFYYRLKQVDFNGNFTYSSIRSENLSTRSFALQSYPDPATSTININWINAVKENTTLQLINMRGQIIYVEKVSGQGIMNKQIDVSGYSAGKYYIQIISSSNIQIQPFIKN